MKPTTSNGLTLIETLLSTTVVMVLVASFFHWYIDQQREQRAIVFGKDLVSIITAFDNRIHIDGLDIQKFKNGKEWGGSQEIIEMLNTEFIAKQSSCGKQNGWEPVLEKENSTALLPCNFWQKIPYDLDTKFTITQDSEGFIKNFTLIFKPRNDLDFSTNYRFYKKAINSANVKDSTNITGSHHYFFAAASDPTTKINNKDCLELKSECTLIAKYSRDGGNEYLRVDGTNTMINSAIAFKESKIDSKLRCLKWEQNTISNTWESKMVDCGIGIHSETNSPVAVDIATNSSTNQRVMLDRLCPIYSQNADSIIDTGQTSPCGMLPLEEQGALVTYQVVDTISATKGLIKNLYTSSIFSDEINTNFMNVKNDLAVLGNAEIEGTLTAKGTAQFDNNINLTKVETIGNVCSPNGLISRDSKGSILSCKLGVWASLASGLGFDQKWQNMTSSRFAGVKYTNDTDKPIQISVSFRSTKPTYTLFIDDVAVSSMKFEPSITNSLYVIAPADAIVPPGSTYWVNGGIYQWAELR